MSRPVLFDLFSGAGGAGMGYDRAGFRVIGVDIKPQPRYPFEFVQADAMQVLGYIADLAEPWPGAPYPAAIHASPPCQAYSQMSACRPGLAAEYPELVDAVRAVLGDIGLPWVMENVAGSGLAEQDDLFGAHGTLLCGSMFGRRDLQRHRLFEASFPLRPPHHPRHPLPASKAGHWKPGTAISVAGNCAPIAVAREAMGIDWMTRDELAESIPPAYTEYLGGFLMEQCAARSAA
jgi:DNA (cytosine-5)-methyltransferase 1